MKLINTYLTYLPLLWGATKVYNTNKFQPIPRDQEVTSKLTFEENKGKEEIACEKTHLKDNVSGSRKCKPHVTRDARVVNGEAGLGVGFETAFFPLIANILQAISFSC